MNPKILAASVATLLVAAGMFVYLGTGLSAAEPIQPAAAEAGFSGQERREVEPWMPAPGMGTLADASIEALHEISVGASPSEALQKASSSRALALNGNLDDWFTTEAVENCEFRYWFLSDSYVNACRPFESAVASPFSWWSLSGSLYEYDSDYQAAIDTWGRGSEIALRFPDGDYGTGWLPTYGDPTGKFGMTVRIDPSGGPFVGSYSLMPTGGAAQQGSFVTTWDTTSFYLDCIAYWSCDEIVRWNDYAHAGGLGGAAQSAEGITWGRSGNVEAIAIEMATAYGIISEEIQR